MIPHVLASAYACRDANTNKAIFLWNWDALHELQKAKHSEGPKSRIYFNQSALIDRRVQNIFMYTKVKEIINQLRTILTLSSLYSYRSILNAMH